MLLLVGVAEAFVEVVFAVLVVEVFAGAAAAAAAVVVVVDFFQDGCGLVLGAGVSCLGATGSSTDFFFQEGVELDGASEILPRLGGSFFSGSTGFLAFQDGVVSFGFSSSLGAAVAAADFFQDGVLLFSLHEGGLVSSVTFASVFGAVVEEAPTFGEAADAELKLLVVLVDAEVDTDE